MRLYDCVLLLLPLQQTSITWHKLYCLSLDLFSCLLRSLGHAALETALDLVGVHQDRMLQALELARVNPSGPMLTESQSTLTFLMNLCVYHKEWRLHLPLVMAKLLVS